MSEHIFDDWIYQHSQMKILKYAFAIEPRQNTIKTVAFSLFLSVCLCLSVYLKLVCWMHDNFFYSFVQNKMIIIMNLIIWNSYVCNVQYTMQL